MPPAFIKSHTPVSARTHIKCVKPGESEAERNYLFAIPTIRAAIRGSAPTAVAMFHHKGKQEALLHPTFEITSVKTVGQHSYNGHKKLSGSTSPVADKKPFFAIHAAVPVFFCCRTQWNKTCEQEKPFRQSTDSYASSILSTFVMTIPTAPV